MQQLMDKLVQCKGEGMIEECDTKLDDQMVTDHELSDWPTDFDAFGFCVDYKYLALADNSTRK